MVVSAGFPIESRISSSNASKRAKKVFRHLPGKRIGKNFPVQVEGDFHPVLFIEVVQMAADGMRAVNMPGMYPLRSGRKPVEFPKIDVDIIQYGVKTAPAVGWGDGRARRFEGRLGFSSCIRSNTLIKVSSSESSSTSGKISIRRPTVFLEYRFDPIVGRGADCQPFLSGNSIEVNEIQGSKKREFRELRVQRKNIGVLGTLAQKGRSAFVQGIA